MKKKLASTVIACSVAVTQISDIAIFADSAIKENINKEVISSEKNTKKETKILDNSNKSKVVNIKDKYLKKLINETLDRNRPIYGDITVGEMERLTELRKQDSGFQPSSLEGLEYAINLEVINISYSPVSDFSPIQNLSKLREIRFDNNRSNDRKGIIDFDLDFLSNFPNLRVFSLNDSYLTNLTNSGNYRGSTNLSLGINRSKLTNLRMLDGWSLRSLGIEGTNIVDFRELNNISIEQFTFGTSYTELPVEGNNGISTFKNPFYDSDGKPVKPHRIGLGGSYDDINNTITIDTTNMPDYGNDKYPIEYRAQIKTHDSNGDISTIWVYAKIRPIVVENINPIIQGADDITIKKYDEFNPLEGVTVLDAENIGAYKLDLNGTIDTSVSGNHVLEYKATDRWGNSSTKTRNIKVKGNEKPVIHGADDITIKVGDTFNPLDGVTATDTEDITISNIEVEGKVNTSEVGEYTLTYKVTDTDNNVTIVERVVTVRSNEKPVIHGADNITIKVGDTFNPLNGVTATDTEDGTISNIEVEGKVNTSEVGEYTLTYKVTDTDNNVTTVERTITVRSNSKPVIHGSDNITIKVGDTFNPLDGVSATDKEDITISKIEVEGKVNTLEVGEYTLTYKVTDSDNNVTTVERTVTVRSNNKPVIKGADDITIKVGDTFNPLDGVTATDTEDITISNIEVEGKVNTSEVGEYTLTYKVTDTDNNVTTVERVVTVKSNSKPVIHGADNITIKVGDTFNPLDGVTATDTEDGTISNIEVEGKVNTSEVGEYTLMYKVTDTDNNVTTVERTVTVRSNEKPVIKGADDITIKVGDKFNPLDGVSATDKEDITISKIEVTGKVNTSEVGEYKLTYKVTDTDNNVTTVERTITVRSNSKPITPPNTHPNIESTKPTEFEEIVGLNRFETATKISSKWNSAENVVITNAYSIVDSLSATPFASSKDAPILLSDKDNLTDITKNELKRLKTKNVYLIGGYSVLNDNIEKELKNIGINVVRIAGKTRFETSIEIAKYMTKDKKVSNIVIANGIRGLADAVTISPVASEKNMPIILSDIDKLPSGLDFIKEQNIDKTYIIGGTHNISENLSKEIDNITGDVVRVYGEDRDKTNIKVIETFYDTDKLNNIFVSKNGITKDIDLIDSLAVGSLASKEKSPILLVGNKLKEYQKNFIKKVKALKITKVGGNGNENAMNEIKDIVNSK